MRALRCLHLKLNVLVMQLLHACSPMNFSTPVIPVKRLIPDAKRMQKHTHRWTPSVCAGRTLLSCSRPREWTRTPVQERSPGGSEFSWSASFTQVQAHSAAGSRSRPLG